MPLADMLAGDRFVQGYDSSRQRGMQDQAQQLQQASGLMALIQHAQAQQAAQQKAAQAQAYRSAMGALPPGATEEEMLRVARPYQSPDQIGTQITASRDRQVKMQQHALEVKAQMDAKVEAANQALAAKMELAQQAGADRRTLMEMQLAGRKEIIGMMAANRQPPQPRNLQLTSDAEGNQLIVNPDGTTTPLQAPGGVGGVRKAVGTDKPMTEFQGKAALYGTRSAQSDKVLKALEDKISTAGLAAKQATGVVGNLFMSSEQRRVDQAQRDFVNAVLRQESGAVISDAEFANAKKQYFPQPGDDPNTVAQKRANRQMAIQGFARMSGSKGAVDIKAVIDNPLLPGVGPKAVTPQETSAKGGYVEIRKTSDGRTLGKKADGSIEEVK